MPVAIRSSKWSACLNKTKEMHNKTREAERKLELRQTPHRPLLSSVCTAHDPTIPTYGSSVMSVPAVDVDRLPNLRSRCQAIIIVKLLMST